MKRDLSHLKFFVGGYIVGIASMMLLFAQLKVV